MQDRTLFFLGSIEHSLNIQIQMNWEDAQECLTFVPNYNRFTGELAKDILKAADKVLPKNTFSGERDFDIIIGREGSMVMYLKRRFFREMEITSDEDINTLIRYAKDHGLADEADYSIKGLGGFTEETFRFWWD